MQIFKKKSDLLHEQYEHHYFSEIVGHKTVGFDYKIKEWKLKNGNAIKILQINNYPDSIITEAYELASELDGALRVGI